MGISDFAWLGIAAAGERATRTPVPKPVPSPWGCGSLLKSRVGYGTDTPSCLCCWRVVLQQLWRMHHPWGLARLVSPGRPALALTALCQLIYQSLNKIKKSNHILLCAQPQHQDQQEAGRSSIQGWGQPSPTGEALKSTFHFSWPKSRCRGPANSRHEGCHPHSCCRNRDSMPDVPLHAAHPGAGKASSASPKANMLLCYRSEPGLEVLCCQWDWARPPVLGMSPSAATSHAGQHRAASKVPTPHSPCRRANASFPSGCVTWMKKKNNNHGLKKAALGSPNHRG